MPPPTPEQHAAISQLCAAYCWYVDTADSDGLNGLFTADGVFGLGPKDIAGREKVVRFLTNSVRGTHVAGPPLIEITDSGATGRSRFVFAPAAGGPLLAGGYDDEYSFEAGRWRFVRRNALVVAPA